MLRRFVRLKKKKSPVGSVMDKDDSLEEWKNNFVDNWKKIDCKLAAKRA
jgi:hypothetical protein